MSFLKTLNEFADYCEKIPGLHITSGVIAVSEKYARRRLRLKKAVPLVYRGITLRCIGSKRWREWALNTAMTSPTTGTKGEKHADEG